MTEKKNFYIGSMPITYDDDPHSLYAAAKCSDLIGYQITKVYSGVMFGDPVTFIEAKPKEAAK